MHLEFDFCFYCVKFRHCIRVFNCSLDIVISFVERLKSQRVMLSQQIQRPKILSRKFGRSSIRISIILETTFALKKNLLNDVRKFGGFIDDLNLRKETNQTLLVVRLDERKELFFKLFWIFDSAQFINMCYFRFELTSHFLV